MEWQQLVCLRVAATAAALQHTEILKSFRNTDTVEAQLRLSVNSGNLANRLPMPLSWGDADSVFTCCCDRAYNTV